jgi:hypothetical protein
MTQVPHQGRGRFGRLLGLGCGLLLVASGSADSIGDEDVTSSPDGPRPLLERPSLPPAPIVSACEHLLTAETNRVAFPGHVTSLRDALRIASLGSQIPIEGDWAALDAIGLGPEDRLELPTTPATLPVLLEQVVARLADAWDRPRLEATADGLLLTTRHGAERLAGTILHPIGDLLRGEPLPTAIPTDAPPSSAEAMADLVRSMIDPDSWSTLGGTLSRMEVWNDALLVTAPPSIQIGVRRLLDQLRAGRPVEVEADIDLVEIDARTARRLESSRGPGSLAAIRAVAEAASAPALLHANVVAPVDGTAVRTTCRTGSLDAAVTLEPIWNVDRQRLRCRVLVRLLGEAADGERTLETEQEIAIPVGGLVLPLPSVGEQRPLTLLISVRAR